jgi:hypothetical protein
MRADYVGNRCVGFLVHPEHKRDAVPVHHLVGKYGGDDLVPKRMRPDLGCISFTHGPREILCKVRRQRRLFGQFGVGQFLGDRQLGMCNKDRKLRNSQPFTARFAMRKRFVARQRLKCPIDATSSLELRHVAAVQLGHGRAFRVQQRFWSMLSART